MAIDETEQESKRIKETKSECFENINKVDFSQTKKERQKVQINKIRNENGKVTTGFSKWDYKQTRK